MDNLIQSPVPESEQDEFGNFGKNPETYINVISGDSFIIWWACNRPQGEGWIRVSKQCWDIHSGGRYG